MNKTGKKVFLRFVALFCLIALLCGCLYLSAVVLNKVFRPVSGLFHGTPVKTVTIQEGLTAVEVSKLLKEEGIFVSGEALPQELDGYLFPDTYEFFVPSSLGFVVKKLSDNFNKKVIPVIPEMHGLKEVITVASMVEEETNNFRDRRIVAGIIWKRLQNKMFIQVDASICYVKEPPCYPVTKEDLDIDSPYNTYLYKGLPPSPISNPGLDSIKASVSPEVSRFWYYLADPKTGKTIFSVTLEEHNKNIVKYLTQN